MILAKRQQMSRQSDVTKRSIIEYGNLSHKEKQLLRCRLHRDGKAQADKVFESNKTGRKVHNRTAKEYVSHYYGIGAQQSYGGKSGIDYAKRG